jgi:hypothetical protein
MEAVRQAAQRTVEFGIYRDGDNNLDESQGITLEQAKAVSAHDPRVQFTVEDTTMDGDGPLRTYRYTIQDGESSMPDADGFPKNMASEKNLARFVADTLGNAEKSGAKQTWIELTDHGAGDGGGLEADSAHAIMPMPQIAQAIADGVKLHSQEHPEDADRKVDGVVANQCLMASLGFADELSHAGVKYLAASPETMVSPGVPSDVADAIANHSDARGMANAIVSDVMRQKYGEDWQTWNPAAAFDVLDLDPQKIAAVETSVKALNDDIAARKGNSSEVDVIREDAKSVEGMVRFPEATPDMPWHADRPAISLYNTLANDSRLDPEVRTAAKSAAQSVASLVLAHKESRDFEPFGGSNYGDAAGPTVHFPVNGKQVDPWAPHLSETHNRFFVATDAASAERVIA